ncbi:protein kinase [Kitasatospora sp. NPDC090091]|uniref:serine/threonine-protein kinase n=1 Tax=Kitasatospora sp. NPDC090091 TaxID=3364081 RepID=UPI00380001F2
MAGTDGRMIAAGALLGGRYRLVRPLGRGGFGTVFLGTDENLPRWVAVKLLDSSRHDPAELPMLRGRFDREARLMAGLQHPGIVSVLDRGSHQDTPFIVMEHLAGPDLAAVLGDGPLPIGDLLRHAARIADALHYAHTQPDPVVHRDLKPSNLMLDARGEVKILDFGIAAAPTSDLTAYTRIGTRLGTRIFMSPEQLRGEPAAVGCDLYAFGAVLYNLLAGRPPFLPTHGDVELEHQVLSELPRPVTHYRPETPAGLAALVHALLAKDAAQRPSAAEAMARLTAGDPAERFVAEQRGTATVDGARRRVRSGGADDAVGRFVAEQRGVVTGGGGGDVGRFVAAQRDVPTGGGARGRAAAGAGAGPAAAEAVAGADVAQDAHLMPARPAVAGAGPGPGQPAAPQGSNGRAPRNPDRRPASPPPPPARAEVGRRAEADTVPEHWRELEQAEADLLAGRFALADRRFAAVAARCYEQGAHTHPAMLAASFGRVRAREGLGRAEDAAARLARLSGRIAATLGRDHPLTRAVLAHGPRPPAG